MACHCANAEDQSRESRKRGAAATRRQGQLFGARSMPENRAPIIVAHTAFADIILDPGSAVRSGPFPLRVGPAIRRVHPHKQDT